MLTKALRVARDLDDPGLATMLLGPFHVETLAKSHVATAAGVVAHYGPTWSDNVLAAWFRDDGRWPVYGGTDRRAWLDSLPSLCAAASAHSADGGVLATILATRSWAWLRTEIEQSAREAVPSLRAQGLAALGSSVAAALASAAACGATVLRNDAVAFLRSDNDDLLALLMPAVRSASSLDPIARIESGLDSLAAHCAARLAARLARPARAVDEWSIPPPNGCRCGLCATLEMFLRDPARLSHDWPIAEPGRRHIHQTIDAAELPVTHQTRRQGRPYTLVLTKTEAIFGRERRQREQDAVDLAWLSENRVGSAGEIKARRSVAGRRQRPDRTSG